MPMAASRSARPAKLAKSTLGALRRWVGRLVADKTEVLAIFVELAGQCLRSGEAPGGFESAAHSWPAGGLQPHVRAASSPPGARAGVEYGGLGFYEHLLFERSEFDHGPAILRVAKRGKDFADDAEIGVMHVSALFCFGEAESETPKVVGGHGVVSSGGNLS